MSLTQTKTLLSTKVARAGMIPYVVELEDGKPVLYFALGQDRQSGDLTSFGGSSKKKDINVLATAARECKEESKNLFEQSYDSLYSLAQEGYAVVGSQDTSVFVKIPKTISKRPRYSCLDFFETTVARFLETCSREMRAVEWIHEEELKKLISGVSRGVLYEVVRKNLATVDIDNLIWTLKS